MTPEQRQYYKAIYSKQIGALLGGASTKTMPQLRNLAMELRKVCCHPVSGGGPSGARLSCGSLRPPHGQQRLASSASAGGRGRRRRPCRHSSHPAPELTMPRPDLTRPDDAQA
jgi:chromodomain-helicase-DNA-binding protein 7